MERSAIRDKSVSRLAGDVNEPMMDFGERRG
jgi:hypothetical protein